MKKELAKVTTTNEGSSTCEGLQAWALVELTPLPRDRDAKEK